MRCLLRKANSKAATRFTSISLSSERRRRRLSQLVRSRRQTLEVGFHQVAQLISRNFCLHFQMADDVPQEGDDDGHFLLSKKIDLQIQMAAFVGLSREPILAGEDEQDEENRLERDRHGQERKRKAIEGHDARRHPDVAPTQKLNHTTCRSRTGPLAAVHAIQSPSRSVF